MFCLWTIFKTSSFVNFLSFYLLFSLSYFLALTNVLKCPPVSLYKTLSIRTQGNPFPPRHLLFVCYRRLEWLPYKHHYVWFNLFSSPCHVLFRALFILSILCHIWSHLNTELPIVYFSMLREWLSKGFRLNRFFKSDQTVPILNSLTFIFQMAPFCPSFCLTHFSPLPTISVIRTDNLCSSFTVSIFYQSYSICSTICKYFFNLSIR